MWACFKKCITATENIGYGALIACVAAAGALLAIAIALPPTAPFTGAMAAKIFGGCLGAGALAAIVRCINRCR